MRANNLLARVRLLATFSIMNYAADLSTVREAAGRIAEFAHRTPVQTCATLDQLAGRQLFFKCENLQKVGAFKFRGACNAVLQLDDSSAARGVVTHSSGNHAQALALAARMREIPAHIVMPSSASPIKRAGVVDYGANVVECEPTLEARESTAEQVQNETGATFIHPYDNANIIAGQGTAALELIEDVDSLDVIIAPVGGGGLISGTCAAARGLNPSIKIVAAEPRGADDAFRSKAAGEFIPQTGPKTIADGLLTSLGERTWPFVRDMVDRIITVDEDEIVAAMRLAWERAKLLIEPSSAVAIAVALSDEFQESTAGQRVGIILSGGNVNLDQLPW